MKRAAFVAGAVSAAVLVPAASAGSGASVRLGLLPLSKKGLAAWRSNDRRFTPFTRGSGLSIVVEKETVAAAGSRQFAFLVSYRSANIAPLFGLDEQFTEGRYEAKVTVWAGTAAAARKLAPTLAEKLDARIRQALAGKLHAKPVRLAPNHKEGPPSGGPNLAGLALGTTDLSGKATLSFQGYVVVPNPSPLSVYSEIMVPAGPFDMLGQDVDWYSTANQANFVAHLALAGCGGCSQLDLGGVGDGARGFVASDAARVVFSSGRLVETLDVEGENGVQASEVQKTAQIVADEIDEAGLGSQR